MLDKIKKRTTSDDAFMGATHSLFSVLLYQIFLAFVPSFIVWQMGEGNSSRVLILASLFLVAGAALIPDFDNTRSTAMSSLGIVGVLISKAFRAFAVMVYMVTKTRRDDSEPNPHRGFWHTWVSAILIFFIIYASTSISKGFTITLKSREVMITYGNVFAIIWIFCCAKLAFAGLSGTLFKKSKKKYTKIIDLILSLVVAIFVFYFTIGENLDFRWLAFLIAFGHLTHIIGDTLTVAGTPLIFPFKKIGKRWYTVRFLKIHAGGEIEKILILPMTIVGNVILFMLFILPTFFTTV